MYRCLDGARTFAPSELVYRSKRYAMLRRCPYFCLRVMMFELNRGKVCSQWLHVTAPSKPGHSLIKFFLQAQLFLWIQEDPFREAQNRPPETPQSKPSNSITKLFTTGFTFPPDPRGPLPRGPKSASGAPRPNQAILLLNFLLQASLFLRIQEDPF